MVTAGRKSHGTNTTEEAKMRSPNSAPAAKIIRFTQLPDGVVAQYDNKCNVLLVDRTLYDRLPDMHKNIVLKTTSPYMLEMEVRADQTLTL
jgi:hypothetical protein